MKNNSMVLWATWVVLLSFFPCPGYLLGEELQAAPGFSLKDIEKLQEDAVTLSSFQGKVVFLNIFTTTCEVCRAEFPNVIAINDKYNQRGDFRVVGVAIDPMVEPVKSLVSATGINYTVLMGELQTLAIWKVTGFPTSFLINKEGKIYKRYEGFQDEAVFVSDIEVVLGNR